MAKKGGQEGVSMFKIKVACMAIYIAVECLVAREKKKKSEGKETWDR